MFSIAAFLSLLPPLYPSRRDPKALPLASFAVRTGDRRIIRDASPASSRSPQRSSSLLRRLGSTSRASQMYWTENGPLPFARNSHHAALENSLWRGPCSDAAPIRKHRTASLSTANIRRFSGSRHLVRESKCCDGRMMSGTKISSTIQFAGDIWRSSVSVDCRRRDTRVRPTKLCEDFPNRANWMQ